MRQRELRKEISVMAGEMLAESQTDMNIGGENNPLYIDAEIQDYLRFLRDNPDSKIVKGLLKKFQEFDRQHDKAELGTHLMMHIRWIAHKGVPEYGE